MPKVLPIGAMHFRSARERPEFAYVDKSAYIGRILRSSAFVLVHCRPRRFGKTPNLTMLREWLAKPVEVQTGLDPFRDMVVLTDERARAERGRHAVLYLSLKICKADTWSGNLEGKRNALRKAWQQLGIPDSQVPAWFAPQCHEIVMGTLADAKLPFALGAMVQALKEIHGAPVWVLIDEYDAAVQTAWQHGFYRQAVDFLRPFLGEALKDSEVVQKTVLTGILQVAKEGIFSELNGVVVETVLDKAFATDFGFTESEVADLAGDDPRLMADLRSWYNGYNIGGHALYNPWSVANALSKTDEPMQAHWMASGGTELIARIATGSGQTARIELEKLLAGETVRAPFVFGVVMPDIERDARMLLNVMLHTGYVTGRALPREDEDDDRLYMELRLPNREIRAGTRAIFDELLQCYKQPDSDGDKLMAALLAGDTEMVQLAMQTTIGQMLSYHDLADKTPERIYHLFVLGWLARVPKGWQVRSNREFGEGRPDIVLEAGDDGKPSALLEFKTGNSAKAACQVAARQIAHKRYVTGVRGKPVYAWAIGYSGKGVLVRLVAGG